MMTTCNRIKKSGLCFSLNGLGEVNLAVDSDNFLMSNNREGTEERTRDVVEGYNGIASGLGQGNATCLSGAV